MVRAVAGRPATSLSSAAMPQSASRPAKPVCGPWTTVAVSSVSLPPGWPSSSVSKRVVWMGTFAADACAVFGARCRRRHGRVGSACSPLEAWHWGWLQRRMCWRSRPLGIGSTRTRPRSIRKRLWTYRERLYAAALALSHSREDAEDLVQETYSRVLQATRCVEREGEYGYLLSGLRNTFLSALRTTA